ncbi:MULTISPECIES: ABC transporter permease subunit [Rhodopseudomonas]|uniref:ABC transporter permease subunit n=1 Tax=Rhodopseudomonas TaxID=1073 RepID=UPI00142D2E0A|nr:MULTISPECIES: ABC transporter permease subunit [Rhodopseudomonas]
MILLICLANGIIIAPLQESGPLHNLGWTSIWRSAALATASACIEISIATIVIRLLPEKRRSAGQPTTTVEFLIAAVPVATPPVALALLWRLLLEAEGPLATLLQTLGLNLPPLLSTKPIFTTEEFSIFNWAYLTLLFVDAWIWTPLVIVSLLIAFRRIPQTIIDAAKIDGASERSLFWSIQIPLTLDWLAWIWLFRFVDTFRAHDVHWVLFKTLTDILPAPIDVYNRGVALRQYEDAAQLALASTLVSGIALAIVWATYRARNLSSS